jgi:membrane protein implicated in regulation of membrane protease activity
MNGISDFLRPELVWFLIGLVLLFVEMAVPGLIIAFFAFGAWVVAAVCLFEALSLNQQLALFIMTSALALVLARSWLRNVFAGYVTSKQNANTDLNDFVGQRAVVTQKITTKLPGKVDFHGAPWLAAADQEIAEGAVVEIVAKDNLTLKVKLV